MIYEGLPPEDILFDIYTFNEYTWNHGYTDALVDFYLNSPFTATAFYPFVFFEDALMAKLTFNGISILLFLNTMYRLSLHYLKENYWVLVSLPVLFFIPIRNQILFGQSYFIILFLVGMGFLLIKDNKRVTGVGLLSFAALLKLFPIFYGLPLIFNKRWKPIFFGFLITLFLIAIAIQVSGYSLWEAYFSEVFLTAIKNKTTVDFQFNSQSFDVFFKKLFVKDSYHNPEAPFDSEKLAMILVWVMKSIIIGSAVFVSYLRRNNLMELLTIWVVALFLLQSRTATYAQILWVIPAFSFYQKNKRLSLQILFFSVLFLVCNFPYHKLSNMPVIVQFLRLWLVVILAILSYGSFTKKMDIRYILAAFILLLPLNYRVFKTIIPDNSEYVLTEREQFLVFDYQAIDNVLVYTTIGGKGKQMVTTTIPINSFDEKSCEIKENQIFLNGKQLTYTDALKKKAVLINNREVYFLSDHRSRHRVFTLKKLDISKAFD